MFIEIDSSISELTDSFIENSNLMDPIICDQIDDILDYSIKIMKNGNHCIKTKNRNVAYSLYKYAEMIKNEKIAKYFYYVYTHFSSYLGNIKHELTSYVVICNSSELIKRENNVTFVNLEFASKLQFWDSNFLLLEHINDDQYISYLVTYSQNHFITDLGMSTLNFSYKPDQGGGGTSINTFTRRCNDGRFIYGIVDSDKKFEEDSPKATASQFLNIECPPSGFYHVLKVHEIENLFSSDNFLSFASEQTAVAQIKRGESRCRMFYDFKRGYSYCEYINNPFIISCFNLSLIPCESLLGNGNCTAEKKICGRVLKGCGKNYLKEIFEHEQDFLDAPEGLIDEIKNEWIQITKEFLSCFCSYKISI